jgi:tRNA 2-thiouridine synthesizing protein A
MSDSTSSPAATLDTTGLLCPEPLMLVRNRIRALDAGQILHVTATDPSTERDFANFCRFMNHELIATCQRNGTYHYVIRKGG